MSARARRKNRNRGLKKGRRRTNGPTPRHRVRDLRDALLPEDAAAVSPVQSGLPSGSTEVPRSDSAADWTSCLASARPQEFPVLFRQAVTDDSGAVAVLHQLLETASQWCRRHGAHHAASELEEITARLGDVGEDLHLAVEAVEIEVASRQGRAAAANRTSPTVTAQRAVPVGQGGIGVPAPSTAARPPPRSP